MATEHIHIKGARTHNLQNVEVQIKHGSLTAVTGISGSGKSSLVFEVNSNKKESNIISRNLSQKTNISKFIFYEYNLV